MTTFEKVNGRKVRITDKYYFKSHYGNVIVYNMNNDDSIIIQGLDDVNDFFNLIETLDNEKITSQWFDYVVDQYFGN